MNIPSSLDKVVATKVPFEENIETKASSTGSSSEVSAVPFPSNTNPFAEPELASAVALITGFKLYFPEPVSTIEF